MDHCGHLINIPGPLCVLVQTTLMYDDDLMLPVTEMLLTAGAKMEPDMMLEIYENCGWFDSAKSVAELLVIAGGEVMPT